MGEETSKGCPPAHSGNPSRPIPRKRTSAICASFGRQTARESFGRKYFMTTRAKNDNQGQEPLGTCTALAGVNIIYLSKWILVVQWSCKQLLTNFLWGQQKARNYINRKIRRWICRQKGAGNGSDDHSSMKWSRCTCKWRNHVRWKVRRKNESMADCDGLSAIG